MIVVPLAIFCIVLLSICVILLCIALGRVVRTPRLHPDRAARWDMVRLLAVSSVTLCLALARTQFLSNSRPFLILSLALAPCGLSALWLMIRLIGAYRREKARPTDQALPDVKTLRSRISPMPTERNNDDARRKPRS